MTAPLPLVCAGRPVDTDNQPVGEPCGRTFRPASVPVGYGDGHWPHWGLRPPTDGERDQQARAAGWAVGVNPDNTRTAMCPRCRRPDPKTVAICRDLQEGLHP